MTSKVKRMRPKTPQELFVWIWLPGALDPVVAGVLTPTKQIVNKEVAVAFRYAKSYQTLANAISLFTPELPLQDEPFDPSNPRGDRSPLPLHGCIRDSAPDNWGRRVINQRLAADKSTDLDELTYLVNSGSNRIGALDFQTSATIYKPRWETATLEQLLNASEYIESGHEIPKELQAAAGHGTSIGGATPKALFTDGGKEYIAKFSTANDDRTLIQAEAAANFLAKKVGIQTAESRIETVSGKKVLLIERFDRLPDGSRRQMISALTILGESEFGSHHSSYGDIADAIREGSWEQVTETLRELFTRMVFNVCIGNTDDHLRNHAAFWDGKILKLTPAYDLSPQRRSGEIASQAIAITKNNERESQLRLCRKAAPTFGFSSAEAEEIISNVLSVIEQNWSEAVDYAQLGKEEAEVLWKREFLNPYIYYDYP